METQLDLNRMGLSSMSTLEMQEIDGGVNWWLVGALVLGVAAIVLTGGTAAVVLGAEVAAGMADAATGAAFCCTVLAI